MANPTLLEMPIARDGAKNSIPSTTSPTTGLLSQQFGWQDINSMPVQQGGKAPSRLDFNGVLNLLSNILFYSQKGWQFEWDSSQAYYAGCVVKDTSDGKMYQCLNDITSNTAPHSDTTNWKLWDLSMLADYLPLTGGTLSGNLKIQPTQGAFVGGQLVRNDDINDLLVHAGTIDNGAEPSLILRPSGHPSDPSNWQLLARDSNSTHYLKGSLNGLLYDSYDLSGSAIVQKSLTSNGYIKRLSGEITEWGSVALPSSGTYEADVSFSLSFSVNPKISMATIQTGSGVETVTVKDGTLSPNGFTIQGSGYCIVQWVAVGY